MNRSTRAGFKFCNTVMLLILFSLSAFAQEDAPDFNDYAVPDMYSGANHALVLDTFGKQYKTKLSEALKTQKPNFAGHFIVVTWGCGTDACKDGAIIDAKTGKAYPFPVILFSVSTEGTDFEVEDNQQHIFYTDSRLMVFAGNTENSKHTDGSDVIEYYEFKDGQFVFVKSMPFRRGK